METIIYVTLAVSAVLFFNSGISLLSGDKAYLPRRWFKCETGKTALMCRVVGLLTLFMAVAFAGGAAAGIFGANDELVSSLLTAVVLAAVCYEGFGFCVRLMK